MLKSRSLTALILIVVLLLFLLAGCKEITSATDVALSFLSMLEAQKYDEAYDMLSISAQKQFAREEFTGKYQAIFDELGLSSIDVLSLIATESPLYTTVDYDCAYLTKHCGELSNSFAMNLVKQSDGWKVEWAPTLIFPEMIKDDTVRVLRLNAKRGEIFSKNGELLAANVPGVSVYGNPESIEDKAAFADALSELIGMTSDEIRIQLERSGNRLAVFKSFLPDELSSEAQAALLSIKGVGLDTNSFSTFRQYPQGEAFFHITGYAGKITEDELKKFKGTDQEKLYNGDSIIGKSGLELSFDKLLRGKDGREVYIADKLGNKKRSLYVYPAVNGVDLHLSIDTELQNLTYDLLKLYLREGQSGVVIVMDPTTGKIDTMTSYPGIDPNRFIKGIPTAEWDLINKPDGGKPLFNRALSGLYPPGSIFKPFTGLIAMEKGVVNANTKFPYKIVDDRWTPERDDWFYPPIKRVENRSNICDFYNGMVYSDNIFFAWAAMEVGKDAFTAFAERLGIGSSVPFDLPIASSRLKNPDTDFNIKFLADTGYGQGELLVTPLQMALLYCALANDGNILSPTLLESQYKESGMNYVRVKEYTAEPWLNGVLDPYSLSKILPAMEGVTQIGTAKDLRAPYRVAAKTGTAEIGADKTREIGWFAGFKLDAPRDKLVIVMVDVGVEEGSIKIDIAKELFRYKVEADVEE